MTQHTAPAKAAPMPSINNLNATDIRAALRAGWLDFKEAPGYGLSFAAFYVVGGWALFLFLAVTGEIWWALPITLGFPLLGPFAAVGLYEVSRRRMAGAQMSPGEVFGVILHQKDRQLPTMAWVVLVFFLFWNFLAHMLFALFMGLEVMTNVSSSLAYLWTVNGITMLVVGSVVGGVLATILFMITVISLPLLLDKEFDFVTAMIVSWRTVTQSPKVLLGWGGFVAVALFLAMLPAFVGLLVVLPVLGHASWHVYLRAVSHPES